MRKGKKERKKERKKEKDKVRRGRLKEKRPEVGE